MSDYQKGRCAKVLDALCSRSIAEVFATPVDPERDNCPTYLKVIENPMDFSTVRKKLEADKYATVEQWKSDVELIFENSYKFNTRQSLISMLAKQLQTEFHELTENLTSNPVADWVVRMHRLKTELNTIFQNGPRSCVQNGEVVRRIGAAGKDKAGEKLAMGADKGMKHKQSRMRMSEEEQMKLIENVNNLSDDEQIRMAVDLIKKCEPELVDVDEGEVELDVSNMSANTLFSLKKLVDGFNS